MGCKINNNCTYIYLARIAMFPKNQVLGYIVNSIYNPTKRLGIIKLRMTPSLTVAPAIAVVLMTLLTAASGIGVACSKNDILVTQSQGPPEFNGIPTYMVQIINRSPTGCSISDIHLSCGSFSSARLINPNTFKRLKHNDCLVNGGKPLRAGYVISFTYVTTFKYPLSVSSIKC